MEGQSVTTEFQNGFDARVVTTQPNGEYLLAALNNRRYPAVQQPPPSESEAPGAVATATEGKAKEEQAPPTPEARSAQAVPLRTFTTAMATAIYEAVNATAKPDDLDQLARGMWRAYAENAISQDDGEFLSSYIERIRPHPRLGRPIGIVGLRQATRLIPRQHPRSPDRKASRDRRRTLGGSAVMPPNLRIAYTEGQRAVLCVVAGEIKHHGICDVPIDKIAALAGVCRTTVQTTLHEARRLFHVKTTERPKRGRKSLTNLVQIIDPEWLAWIKRGPTAHRPIGSNSVKIVSTTKNTDFRKEEGTFDETRMWHLSAPPNLGNLRPIYEQRFRAND
jgi:hypothetical protein